MRRENNQFTLDFSSHLNEKLACIRSLREIRSPMSVGSWEGIISLLERLIIMASDVREDETGRIHITAQVIKIACGIKARSNVSERTVRRWARNARALGLLDVDLRSRRYGYRHWNEYYIRWDAIVAALKARELVFDGKEAFDDEDDLEFPSATVIPNEQSSLNESTRLKPPTSEATKKPAQAWEAPTAELETFGCESTRLKPPTSEATEKPAQAWEAPTAELETLGCELTRLKPPTSEAIEKPAQVWEAPTAELGEQRLELVYTVPKMAGHGRTWPATVAGLGADTVAGLGADTVAGLSKRVFKRVLTHEDEPPAADTAIEATEKPDRDWRVVASELRKMGLVKTEDALRTARERGLTIEAIDSLTELYRTQNASDPRVTVGWLYRWIVGLSDPPQPVQRAPRQLGQRGDAMSRDELQKATLRVRIVKEARRSGCDEDEVRRRCEAAGVEY